MKTWTITVCRVCDELVDACKCDPDRVAVKRGRREPPVRKIRVVPGRRVA